MFSSNFLFLFPQVHDELVMEADSSVVKEAGLLLRLSMESAASLLGKGLKETFGDTYTSQVYNLFSPFFSPCISISKWLHLFVSFSICVYFIHHSEFFSFVLYKCYSSQSLTHVLSVPLHVKLKVGTTWGSMEPFQAEEYGSVPFA